MMSGSGRLVLFRCLLLPLREGEALRRLSASLQGARIAVDAGHGGGDPGAGGPAGTREAEVTYRLARELVEELTARGAHPIILRSPAEDPPPSERARLANEFGAEILISLHLNSHDDPQAEGCSTYYYGREGWDSRPGRRLAELIQDELTRRLGLKDGRAHAKGLPLLRETRMPAVHVEPCFITNPGEEALLAQESFRADVASCIAEAAERFFGRLGDAPQEVEIGSGPTEASSPP